MVCVLYSNGNNNVYTGGAYMNIRMAIDGACRRNGKENCVSSSGTFIEIFDNDTLVDTHVLSNFEIGSTNQRGELLALCSALTYIKANADSCHSSSIQIVTDSEYIYNAMTKEWYLGWESRGWLTASLNEVKNSDLWKSIKSLYEECKELNAEIIFYHIKGHCIPFGKVTANTLLSKEDSGKSLRQEVLRKYDSVMHSKKDILDKANELSLKNNGFKLEQSILREFVVINTIADAIATRCVDAADALMTQAASNGS